MIRLVATLVSAILLSRPGMPRGEATRYAKVLNEIGEKHSFDPLLAVAIVHFESRWSPSQVSDDGEDYGLGQVRARFIGACRGDEDPLGNPSEGCRAVKASLLAGEHNLRVMGGIIEANQELCKDKTGTAKPSQWLAGYAGLNFPERNRWCQPGEKTWRVLSYYEELVARLLPKPKKSAPAKPAAAKPGLAKPGLAKPGLAKPGAAPAKRLRVAERAKSSTPSPKR